MEKAINSSMPEGRGEEGKGGRGRMSGDISNRGNCEGGQEQMLHNITVSYSKQ